MESLPAWRVLLRIVGQIWVFLRACFLRWRATLACIYWVIFSCFSYISSFYFILSLSNWDYESVSPNRKLNLITWWISFSLDRRSAIIHVFTETPPTQMSRKVVRFMQNEPHLFLYKAQLTNVNIRVGLKVLNKILQEK